MTFSDYLTHAWNDHATQTEKVASSFANAPSLVKTNDELNQLAALVTHVMGEHLARWKEGITALANLKTHPTFAANSETEKTINRSIAALQIGDKQTPDLKPFSHSDQIRILCTASSAICIRGTKTAASLLRQALLLAEPLDKKDPANRTLAATGNNVAAALEEKSPRAAEDTELMILAAKTGRHYWEVAGTWLEISRAEYRLAMTQIQAGDLNKALLHAQACINLCTENKASDLDLFYAFESLAHVEKNKKNYEAFQSAVALTKKYFEKLSTDDKRWCESSLKKLTS